jgi:hypothetical protein
MNSQAWINLFRTIPVNLHDGLALTLTTSAEVIVQSFVKLDPDFVILRGRMAGTQDTGRVVILPYSNLVSVNFARRMTEPEIEAVFGRNVQACASAAPEASGNAATVTNECDAVNASARPAMPSKTALLAKLRARLNDGKK